MSDPQTPDVAARNRKNWLATGGLVGAILAASCCIVPLILIALGVSGTWIGSLTALEPYKPWFIAMSVGFIGLGFWYVYFRTPEVCEEDSYCAKPESSRLTKAALWLGSFIVLAAASIDYWAPFFY